MLASSFGDPVIGVDVHFQLMPAPPAPPIPAPIPNPFTGVVFDPVGLAVGIAIGAAVSAVLGAPIQGPVLYWGAFPATNTGTEAKHVPGHILIPPGVGWAPFPKTPKPVIHPGEVPAPGLPVKPENDAVVVFGSKTVTVMGSNAVRLGDIALSCSEPVRLPSSVVMAVPKGAPILIGGPPSLDIMAAILASLRTRFVSDSLHAALSRLKPSRFRNFLNRAVCFFTGHPVDVASGRVMTSAVDFDLPGTLRFPIERVYSSAFADRAGVLGHGWSLSADQAIWRERGRVVLLAEDGREIEFDTFDCPDHTMRPGQTVWNRAERLSLRCELDGKWQVVDAQGTVRQFEPVGRDDGRAMLTRMFDRARSETIELSYDKLGRLQTMRNAAGVRLLFRHDAAGRIRDIHVAAAGDRSGRLHRRFVYDAHGDLIEATDALGHRWRYGYVTHLLTQETNRNGLSFYFVYDGLGADARCVRTWGDDGIYDHALAYDTGNHTTFVTNSLGAVTQYHTDLVGRVTKIVAPHGGETTIEYDPDHHDKISETDALGHKTEYRYDARGNLVEVVEPDGTVTTTRYDDNNCPVQLHAPCEAQWDFQYDRERRLLRVRAPDGATTSYGYRGSKLDYAVDPAGGRTQFEYDAAGRLAARTSAGGRKVAWQYDELGRITAKTDAAGNVQRRSYDGEGRVVRVDEPDGNIRELGYDGEGNIVRCRDRLRDVELSYWGLGLLASRTSGGHTVRRQYDTEGRLLAVVNERGLRHEFERDEQGQIVVERAYDGSERTFLRDVLGRPTEVLRPDGKTTTYAYDSANRVVATEHGDGSQVQYTYRADGHLVRAQNADGVVELERDALGQVLRERQGEDWVATQYDHRRRPTAFATSKHAREEIARDPDGRVLHVAFEAEGQRWDAHFDRDDAGREVARRLPGEVSSQWQRDRLGRPSEHRIGTPHQVLRQRRYEWELDRRLHAVGGPTETDRRLEYDHRGFLTRVSEPESVEERAFDGVGNLYGRADGRDREYGKAGELLAATSEAGVERYEYEGEGRLVAKTGTDGGIWAYRWNDEGNLTEVSTPEGSTISFRYDPFGRRIEKRARGKITRWLWNGNVPCHEWTEDDPDASANDLPAANDGSGPNTTTWLFEPGTFTPMARIDDDGAASIVADHLGTPLEVVDGAGRRVWTGNADSRGTMSPAGAPEGCPFRFPGQYADAETGLHYNRFRYYDPQMGAYISRDPIGLRGGLRYYGYVGDPFGRCDPLGLIDPWDIAFSQDSIGDTFLHGDWAGRTLDEAIAATRDLGHLPDGLELNVMSLNDQWVTLNNRTLYVLQQANLPQVHPNDVGHSGINQLNKLLDGGAPLPLGEQPEVRSSCS
ncbi:MAG: DUF6531 domain-containing protein [Myxococcota bacterium]